MFGNTFRKFGGRGWYKSWHLVNAAERQGGGGEKTIRKDADKIATAAIYHAWTFEHREPAVPRHNTLVCTAPTDMLCLGRMRWCVFVIVKSCSAGQPDS